MMIAMDLGSTLQTARTIMGSDFEEDSVVETMRRAVEVIGDRVETMRWLGTPVRALDYATPVSRMSTPEGRETVLAVLGRLEHGVL